MRAGIAAGFAGDAGRVLQAFFKSFQPMPGKMHQKCTVQYITCAHGVDDLDLGDGIDRPPKVIG